MDRGMWQDHLILCSKLIVEHAKVFTSRLQDPSGSTGSTLEGEMLIMCIITSFNFPAVYFSILVYLNIFFVFTYNSGQWVITLCRSVECFPDQKVWAGDIVVGMSVHLLIFLTILCF
jgi:hypothetical protein